VLHARALLVRLIPGALEGEPSAHARRRSVSPRGGAVLLHCGLIIAVAIGVDSAFVSLPTKRLVATMRVLIADDYDDAREAMKALLELRGINVIEARDGREAVERAVGGHPDLILLDLEMPVMDGFAALERLRHIVHLADVPIIAISAHTDTAWVERAMAYGFTAYLSKPLRFETLLATLSRYLPDASA